MTDDRTQPARAAPTLAAETYRYREHAAAPGSPLLFLFHGTGGDEGQFFGLARQLLPEAGLVSPRGDVSEYGAARFFRREGEGRYDMADLARATMKMADFVEAKVAERRASRVLGLGYSNGANILASVLLRRPGLFDAAVLMHPLIPFEPEADGSLDGCRILVTAGRNDPICPPPLTIRLARGLEAAGAGVETVWHSGGHEIAQGEIDAATRLLATEAENQEGLRA